MSDCPTGACGYSALVRKSWLDRCLNDRSWTVIGVSGEGDPDKLGGTTSAAVDNTLGSPLVVSNPDVE